VKSAVKSSTVEPTASEASMKAASTKAASVTTVTAAGRYVKRILSAGRGRWSRVGT
jgi:hypothetical protein